MWIRRSFIRNETQVGNAIGASGIPRDDIFVTTKTVFDHDPARIRDVFAGSLERLQTDYVDLFLIHWPVSDEGLPGAWETLLRMKDEGLCRSVGVSNITVRRFEEVLLKHSRSVPAVNQVELHVYNQQPDLVNYCRGKGMVLEAYSPLAQARRLSDPGRPLTEIAEQCGKTVAQVMLRFLVQQGIVTLVKSQTPSRIRENAAIFDFALSGEQVASIKAMNENASIRTWEPEGYY
jgi:diketogulonate reductase-like aldo/keto reductase